MSFLNKVVLITGASSGVGAAAAVHFARLSAKLVLVGRNAANLERVAADCARSGGEPLVIVADVSKDADVERIVKTAKQHFDRLDVLVNNAGISYQDDILNMSMEKYDEIMNTNLRAVFNLTRLAVPLLLESKGNIVNISSVVGVKPITQVLTYSVSKAALNHFTRAIAMQLAPQQVRANSIVLGFADTGINDYLEPQVRADFIKGFIPMGVAVDLNDVSRLIEYLASDAAKSITGHYVAIDGGSSIM